MKFTELDTIAYSLFCNYMTSDVKVNGYTKEAFVKETNWFCSFYQQANIILRKYKLKTISDGINRKRTANKKC